MQSVCLIQIGKSSKLNQVVEKPYLSNCLQSLLLGAAIIVLNIGIAFVFPPLTRLIALLALALSIVLMIKSYQGEKLKLPVVGDIAEKNS